ncbi:PREDICTED: avidin-like [Apaloderma vittatum]|uniref:avidin-like n=1 Tax=Apaloderma vittatum TaxID=57397 RepID=UPI000521A795|nr:PREDICTED: avidin-like [Apaloderma vittatum]
MNSSSFILFLTLALVACVTPAERKCLLSGSWRSETGCSPVPSRPGPAAGSSEILTSPLEGSQQDAALVPQPIFSFTVHWQLRDSETEQTSTFLGQCYVGTKGEETLHTMWLLREAAESSAEDWKATRIGTSVFTRIK